MNFAPKKARKPYTGATAMDEFEIPAEIKRDDDYDGGDDFDSDDDEGEDGDSDSDTDFEESS